MDAPRRYNAPVTRQDQKLPQLSMIRASLDHLPEIELPDGYTIRTYPEGGESHLVRVCQAAFEDETYDEDWFEQQMQGSPDYRPDRIIFVGGRRMAVV